MQLSCQGQCAASHAHCVCKMPASHRRAVRALPFMSSSDLQDVRLDSLQLADELIQKHHAPGCRLPPVSLQVISPSAVSRGQQFEVAVFVLAMQDVRLGGLQHANALVQKGHAQAADFHLLAGSSLWSPGQLEQEVAAGCWHAVTASMPVLRQCILGEACCSFKPHLLS